MNAIAIVLLLGVTMVAVAAPLVETRQCGEPPRTAAGDIKRRGDVLRAFEAAHPCPVTGQPGVKPGTCPGWYRDHVIPLACGGCDAVSNLQWLPLDQWRNKSLWERRVYGGKGLSPGCP